MNVIKLIIIADFIISLETGGADLDKVSNNAIQYIEENNSIENYIKKERDDYQNLLSN